MKKAIVAVAILSLLAGSVEAQRAGGGRFGGGGGRFGGGGGRFGMRGDRHHDFRRNRRFRNNDGTQIFVDGGGYNNDYIGPRTEGPDAYTGLFGYAGPFGYSAPDGYRGPYGYPFDNPIWWDWRFHHPHQ